MEEIENLAKKVLTELEDYCCCECKSYCCRKGHLIVSDDELELIAGNKKEILFEKGAIRKMMFGKNFLDFDNCSGGCPALKNFKCLIHNHPGRPNTCKNFPIFIVGKEIKISSRCPAKKENRFLEFEEKAKKLGYKIVENFSFF